MKNLIVFLFIVSGCAHKTVKISEDQKIIESARLNEFFEQDFITTSERSPETLTFLGSKKKYEQLDDISFANFKKEVQFSKEAHEKLMTFNREKLNEQAQISFDLYEKNFKDIEPEEKFFFHTYVVNQMFGRHTDLVDFMLNKHTVVNEPQAWSYIARLRCFQQSIKELTDIITTQNQMGIKYPHFVFEHVIRDSKNIISGFPFQNTKKDSELYKDFRTKVARISSSEPQTKNILMTQARLALVQTVKPAYLSLIKLMEDLEKEQKEARGVWALPDGAEYYKYRLKQMTTTDLTPEQIHKLGLKEVERIHKEMKVVMEAVAFNGTLQEFFVAVKKDPKLFYANSNKGRHQYLQDTQNIIANIRARASDLFNTQPKAELVVKPVEKYREKSSGIAFYDPPAPDGSRPGIYYVNMSDMSSIPKYDMEALAYHEAVPGHHMQLALAQELEGVPKFRRYNYYNAYTEGWGLYSEALPKELPKEFGFYKDPYSEFGRLNMELLRSARLVVDTGIHYYKWTREQAIDYMLQNSPDSVDSLTKEVERYFVMPGQATAYKVGQLKILELRNKAEKALKGKFKISEFHDVILKSGSVPFDVLEKVVDNYVTSKK